MGGLGSTSFNNASSAVKLDSDLAGVGDDVVQHTKDSWGQTASGVGSGEHSTAADLSWGSSGGNAGLTRFLSANNAAGACAVGDTTASNCLVPVSDTMGRRYLAPINPLGILVPGSPENEDWTRNVERLLKGVFNSDKPDGAVGDKAAAGNTANAPGATAAAGATPPEDPDDVKQRKFLASVDDQLDDIQETTDNAYYDHLKDSDLDGARLELDDQPVAQRADGKPFDHVDEVITGQKSLMRGIEKINSLMKRVPINTPSIFPFRIHAWQAFQPAGLYPQFRAQGHRISK